MRPSFESFVDRVKHLPENLSSDGGLIQDGNLPRDVAHFSFVLRSPELEIPLPEDYSVTEFFDSLLADKSVIDLYTSPNGLALLRLFDEHKLTGSTAIFVEYNDADVFSPAVFEIKTAVSISAGQWMARTRPLQPILMGLLALASKPDEYRRLVELKLHESRVSSASLMKPLVSKSVSIIEWLREILGELVDLIAAIRAPEGLWNLAKRSRATEVLVTRSGETIDNGISKITEFIAKWGEAIDLSSWLDKAFPVTGHFDLLRGATEALRGGLKMLEMAYSAVVGFLKRLTAMFAEMRPPAGAALNGLIGYVSGVWDALIDLVAGIVEIIQLVLLAIIAQLRVMTDPRLTTRWLAEALDQVTQTFARIEWLRIFDQIWEVEFPKIRDYIELELDNFSEDSAQAGYLLGYILFNIAELFFPPLKLTKVSKFGRRAAAVATRVRETIA